MPQHVLVVEDSELVVGALEVFLESEGKRVSIAATVKAAIHVVDTDPPDVILLDLSLPDGDGLIVARHARSVAPAAHIIATTGYEGPEIVAACQDAGCGQVLIKPVSIFKIREVLNGL